MSLHLLPDASPRKRRLLACACIRSMWWLVPHELRRAVLEAEEMKPIDPQSCQGDATEKTFEDAEYVDALRLLVTTAVPSERVDDTPAGPGYLDVVAEVLTPCVFLPEWRTSTVVALAEQMYDSRDFSAMPILADALMDADCTDEAILAHCRRPGPHVRGCFCVDAILKKS